MMIEPMCAAMKAYVKTQIPVAAPVAAPPVAAPVVDIFKTYPILIVSATRPDFDKDR
jgi:hypothetical protein